jgi:hypothetical protein
MSQSYENRGIENQIDRYTAAWDATFALRDAMKNPIARELLKEVNEDLKHF